MEKREPSYTVVFLYFFVLITEEGIDFFLICFYFYWAFWALKSLQMVIAAMKLKEAYFLEGKL